MLFPLWKLTTPWPEDAPALEENLAISGKLSDFMLALTAC